ncbi:hypothetical protein MUU49_11100 [Scandinavium goeteborgense]|uniref:DUF2541 family protein n=1 Tax=Scandinavium goeteborgense TaxID=1851514 RepID=UPI00216595CD|nr:hypothetical protein [Scandinavium goeteborgense]MCS2153111.1 hypothetical protein [Scandinavium goeteborgense]
MTKTLKMIACAVLMAATFNSYAGDWKQLGSAKADFSRDHDTIRVFTNTEFSKLKFRVSNAPLNMKRMVVEYDNGHRDTLRTVNFIREGGESRNIDLRGVGKRKIRKVDFWYETRKSDHRKANVTLYGKK